MVLGSVVELLGLVSFGPTGQSGLSWAVLADQTQGSEGLRPVFLLVLVGDYLLHPSPSCTAPLEASCAVQGWASVWFCLL